MPYKDPEKMKEYRKRNKEKLNKQAREYHIKNRDKVKLYQDTNEYKQVRRISGWKRQGILCFDYNLLHDLFFKTTHCEYCGIFLQGRGRDCKCVDHDHSITDKFNIRGILCKSCNNKDVLN